MKLSELIIKLQAIQEEYGDLDCVEYRDFEWNGYYKYENELKVGKFEKELGYFDESENEINAVCVN
jgi:hypothetical protein